jgi:hypothetical protein
MDTANIVREIDAEIARLTSARKILASANSTNGASYSPKPAFHKKASASKPGSRISAAGRKRLSELMKQRWAERRKRAANRGKGGAKAA